MTSDASLRRCIRLLIVLAGAAASVAMPSIADARERDEWRARRFERNGGMAMHEGHRGERARRHDGMGPQSRDMRRPEPPPREMPVQAPPQVLPPPPPPVPVDNGGRPGRLTPDERRALRQQINDAGRDVYRPNRP